MVLRAVDIVCCVNLDEHALTLLAWHMILQMPEFFCKRTKKDYSAIAL